MIFEFRKQVGFSEVDSSFQLRLKGLVDCLLQAAAQHSNQVGWGSRHLIRQGTAWMLYRLAVTYERLPVLEEQIEVVTWHKGVKGFRAYRDFEIFQDHEKIATASSIWVFIDLERKKILKVPAGVQTDYGVESSSAEKMDIEDWKPDTRFAPHTVANIATRPSDYDPLGHVNSAVYFDYLESLPTEPLLPSEKSARILIQFNREIHLDVGEIEIGMSDLDGRIYFKITSPGVVHASGEFRVL